ncbi:MAG TPA: mechanosensitive ion channel domain-containing protein [Nitrospira sp.]|nr:mechanosensitive ion channel domain-containing protein [Nitrospira sp.]
MMTKRNPPHAIRPLRLRSAMWRRLREVPTSVLLAGLVMAVLFLSPTAGDGTGEQPGPAPRSDARAPAPGSNPAAAAQADLADIRTRRAQAQAELQAVDRPETLGAGAPRGTPEDELLERRTLLHHLVRSYDEQIENRERMEHARARRENAADAAVAEDPTAAPPYSIFSADQLWDSAQSLRLAMEGLQSQLDLIGLRFDKARTSLEKAEEDLRQATERAEAAGASSESERLRWLRDLSSLRQRSAAAMLGAAEVSKTRLEAELADTRARLDSAERRFRAVEPHVLFTEADLAKAQARLTKERQDLAGELERTTADRRQHGDALKAMEKQLAARVSRVTSKQSGKRPRGLRRMQAAAEVTRLETENLALKADLLELLLDIVEGERQLWDTRFAIAQGIDPATARDAYNRFTPLFTNFQASRDYLRQQAQIASGQISELENRVANAADAEERAHLRRMVALHHERERAYDRALQRVDQASHFLERWKSEFKERHKELPLSARLEEWSQHAWRLAVKAWNFEVFAAEDTIEVDGKTITGRRSVTVGKIVSALAILLIGYWICLRLAALLGRLAVKRLGLTPELGHSVRLWSQAVLLTILIVVSLVSVKIPLTVFAFLGGAFAIGVGFGAQNLLKNVISGILLLIERPLRVGDLIEVDNVRGRVTTIGLRSSTVRDTKGMDTLIPNSSFLERHLTNWTYSSRISRFSIRVGAPYGASTQQVMEILATTALEHPQVLQAPRPQVLLEEFGSQARIFTLNFWLEIRLDVDPNQVASELRFTIEEQFSKAGLKIVPAA